MNNHGKSGADLVGAEFLVRLNNICLTIKDHRILEDIQLTLHPAEIMTVIGPNGAGKSSLAKVILGLIKPGSGTVTRKPGLRIGYVPQKFHTDSAFPVTVKRFLQMAAHRKQWQESLRRTDMLNFADQPLSSLSGGEMQRVLLARAIQLQPHLLVLDEPAQGIDLSGQTAFYQLIREARDELQCGVLLVSHDLHLVMAATDQVLCLNKHICCAGHPEMVSSDPSFLHLFGSQTAAAMAVYHHHHDHHHHTDGTIASGSECHKTDDQNVAGRQQDLSTL